MQMVMFVLDDPSRLDEVLDAWQEMGIQGATIMESTGLYRRRAHIMGTRYGFGFPRVVERVEEGHYTIFAVVPDASVAQRCLTAVEAIIGDLAQPHTGVFAAWNLDLAKGMLDAASLNGEADA